MTNSPKWKVCRDCGYEPEYKTTRMECGKCENGLLRVKRGEKYA